MVLSAENCARAVALVEDGRNYGYVAIVLNTSRSSIERVEWWNISQVTTRGLIDGMYAHTSVQYLSLDDQIQSIDVYLSENVVGSY